MENNRATKLGVIKPSNFSRYKFTLSTEYIKKSDIAAIQDSNLYLDPSMQCFTHVATRVMKCFFRPYDRDSNDLMPILVNTLPDSQSTEQVEDYPKRDDNETGSDRNSGSIYGHKSDSGSDRGSESGKSDDSIHKENSKKTNLDAARKKQTKNQKKKLELKESKRNKT
jgi:hypothetical protein